MPAGFQGCGTMPIYGAGGVVHICSSFPGLPSSIILCTSLPEPLHPSYTFHTTPNHQDTAATWQVLHYEMYHPKGFPPILAKYTLVSIAKLPRHYSHRTRGCTVGIGRYGS